MASKSPAELKSEGADLKAVLAKVKKKQHNCAMLLSKDGIVLEVHLKKSPEVLLKAAKKAGGMAKGAWGTITMDGQVLIIDPINDKIPGSLTKIAKKYFGERGLKNRLEIKEPEEGAAAAEEAAPEEEAAAPADGGEAAPAEDGAAETDPRIALEARLEAMQSRIDELQADTENVMFSALQDMMGLYTRAVEDELFDRADDSLNKVEIVLDDYDGLMAEKRPFLERMKALLSGVTRIERGANKDAATAVTRYRAEFEAAVENSEWFSSGEKLDQIEALIGEHEDGGAEEAEAKTDAPEEPVEESAPSAPESPAAERSASEETEGATPTGGDEADPRTALEARLAGMQSRVDELQADTGNVMFSALQDMMGLYTRAVNDELFDRADDSLSKVESVLDDYDGLMAEKRPFLDRMKALLRGVESVERGANEEAATAVARYRREFEYAVENSEWFSSGEKLDQIEALIGEHADHSAEAEAGSATPEESGGPESAASGGEDPVSEGTGDARGDLLSAFKAMTPQIKATLKSGDKDTVKKVALLAKGFAQAIKGGDLAKSQKIMDMLQPIVADSADSGAAYPDSGAEPAAESAANPAEGNAVAKEQARGKRMGFLKRMRSSLDALVKEMQ